MNISSLLSFLFLLSPPRLQWQLYVVSSLSYLSPLVVSSTECLRNTVCTTYMFYSNESILQPRCCSSRPVSALDAKFKGAPRRTNGMSHLSKMATLKAAICLVEISCWTPLYHILPKKKWGRVRIGCRGVFGTQKRRVDSLRTFPHPEKKTRRKVEVLGQRFSTFLVPRNILWPFQEYLAAHQYFKVEERRKDRNCF